MTFIPEETSPNTAPSTVAQPHHAFTIEELPDGGDNLDLTNVEILHPDELEEYRSDDDDDDDDDDTDTDTRIQKVPQDTDTSDTPDSDTAAIARRMRRLRTNDKSKFASAAVSQRRQQQRRAAAGLSPRSFSTTGLAGKKRAHIQQQDIEANTAFSTDTESESVFAPDDQDVQTSARRLRRRVRGPTAETSSLSPVSKETAFEASPAVGQQHLSSPDSEAMDVDSSPSDPAA